MFVFKYIKNNYCFLYHVGACNLCSLHHSEQCTPLKTLVVLFFVGRIFFEKVGAVESKNTNKARNSTIQTTKIASNRAKIRACSENPQMHILVIVRSAPSQEERIQRIEKTWATRRLPGVEVVSLLDGKKRETRRNQDQDYFLPRVYIDVCSARFVDNRVHHRSAQ